MTVNLIILVEDRRSNSPQAHIGERCRQPASVGKSKLPRAEQVAQGMAKCEANMSFMDTISAIQLGVSVCG